MGFDGPGARERLARLPVSVLAILVAAGLLLTSIAVTSSWSLMHGRDAGGGLHDAAAQACNVHFRNYKELHEQVAELAGLYPGLDAVLTKGAPPAAAGLHRLRRLLRFSAQHTPAQGTPAAVAPAGGVAEPASGAHAGHPASHHGPDGGLPTCLAEVADLHARLYYAMRLVIREARVSQGKAEKLEAEVARLKPATALPAAAPPGAQGPASFGAALVPLAWDPSKVGLDTGVVLGTPVHFQGQDQYMVVPVNDEYVGGQIRQTKAPFQQEQLAVMVEFISEGSTVLDIGGNLGTYAIWYARKTGPRGMVYSFEAQSFIHQVLTTNLLINGHRNVRALHTAVSFKAGVTHMGDKLVDGSTGGKNFSQVAADKLDQPINYGGRRLGEGGEEVPMITIDSLNITNISFVKLDIQGSEPLAVYGARNTITTNKPVVQFENEAYLFNVTEEMIRDMGIPPEVQTFSIQAFLRSLDYRLVHMFGFDEFWVPPGYKHALYGWDTGALSAAHFKAGLRGGQEFAPNPLQVASPPALGLGLEGTGLPLPVAPPAAAPAGPPAAGR